MNSRSSFYANAFRTILTLVFLLPLFAPTSAAASSTTLETEGASQSIQPGQVPDGLTSAQWENIQQAIIADKYAFSAENDTATAYNPTQNWDLSFGTQGLNITPRSEDEDWTWGLSLRAYGYEANRDFRSLEDFGSLSVDQNAITYQWDQNISEWWINDSAGLEQGFTLLERPASSNQDSVGINPLTVEMAVTGSLTPSIATNRGAASIGQFSTLFQIYLNAVR